MAGITELHLTGFTELFYNSPESSVISRVRRLFNRFHALYFTELSCNSLEKFRNISRAKDLPSLPYASNYGTISQFPEGSSVISQKSEQGTEQISLEME